MKKSKLIALSSVSAALATLSLTLGAYVEVLDLPCVILASVFVMLPLYYKSFFYSLLAFGVSAILTFVFYPNFLTLVYPAYVGFFGLYPVYKIFAFNKKLKPALRTVIGLVWAVAFCYGVYFYYTLIMGYDIGEAVPFLKNYERYFLYGLGVFGAVMYFVYDKLVEAVIIFADKTLRRVLK